jgi:hypothetical protein
MDGADGADGPVENVGPSPKGLIPTVVINDGREGMYKCIGSEAMDWDDDDDAGTDPEEVCAFNVADYFYDNGDSLLDFEFMAIGANIAVKSLPSLDVGVYGVELSPLPMNVEDPFPNTEMEASDGIPNHPYNDVTYEVMASDDQGLWTSQTFKVRRNRRPVVLPAAGENDPADLDPANDSIVVGTRGDGTDTDGKFVVMGDLYFADDDSYRIESRLDDYSIAWHEDDVGKTTVFGAHVGSSDRLASAAAPTTNLYILAVDSGNLDSALYKIAVTVDPAPTLHPTNRVDEEIRVILEDATTYTIADMMDYFDQWVPDTGAQSDEDSYTYCATSNNPFVAEPSGTGTGTATAGCDGVGISTDGDLMIDLKAVGEAEIKVTATEGGDVGTSQSATLSFNLIVDPE